MFCSFMWAYDLLDFFVWPILGHRVTPIVKVA